MTRFEDRPWVFPSVALEGHEGGVPDAVRHVLVRQRPHLGPRAFEAAMAQVAAGGRPAFCHDVGDTTVVVHALPAVTLGAAGIHRRSGAHHFLPPVATLAA